MWENILERGRLQITIWRMRIACWIPKTTKTHVGYVIIIAFPLQQWLHERASVLRYKIYCLSNFKSNNKISCFRINCLIGRHCFSSVLYFDTTRSPWSRAFHDKLEVSHLLKKFITNHAGWFSWLCNLISSWIWSITCWNRHIAPVVTGRWGGAKWYGGPYSGAGGRGWMWLSDYYPPDWRPCYQSQMAQLHCLKQKFARKLRLI